MQNTPSQRKVVLAACFGTFLEWYDFLTFAMLATYFSVQLFALDNPTAARLMSQVTSGAGMVGRALGFVCDWLTLLTRSKESPCPI